MHTKLIILDRDGVINHDADDYIKNSDEWRPIRGSIEAICRLSQAGYSVVVASNQSGLGRGLFSEFDLASTHELMCSLVAEQGGEIAGVFFCPHAPDEGCACRKPNTGLLEQMETEFSTSVADCWFIGDSEKDIDTALAKGCKPILVLSGKGSKTRGSLSEEKLARIHVFDDLYAAALFILADENSEISGAELNA